MEQIFSANLKEAIQQSIKGRVSVHVVNDTLIVDITTSHHTDFRFLEANISIKINRGLTSEYLSARILQAYRKFIINKFFVKKD